jgi:hypothetical protein
MTDDAADGLRTLDTRTAGMSKVTAGYLVEAPRPTLIECGPALSIEHVIESLRDLGMDPDDLAYLVCSHIHLDHAGGAGDVAAAFPSATVVVSEVGARHLVDPSRLNASSRRVYGDLMDTVYGDCTPIEEQRVRGVADGEVLDLGGGVRLQLLIAGERPAHEGEVEVRRRRRRPDDRHSRHLHPDGVADEQRSPGERRDSVSVHHQPGPRDLMPAPCNAAPASGTAPACHTGLHLRG